MKQVLTFMLTLCAYASFSQCKDVYGKKTECPGFEDSLVIYNNAVKVFDFYDKNGAYKLIRTVEIRNEQERKEVFDKLEEAKKMFFVIRREVAKLEVKAPKGPAAPAKKYKDITYNQYFQEIDEYRFYQRELENQIINMSAPASIYDLRISPIVVNEYKCLDSNNVHFGDMVNIPLYIPVAVKPVALLTADEVVLRNEILDNKPQPVIEEKEEKEEVAVIVPKEEVKIETNTQTRKTVENPVPETIVATTDAKPADYIGIPVYYKNDYGGAAIIGFLNNRKLIKIRPADYKAYGVPKYAQQLLENEEELTKWFRLKYGEYCLAFN